MGSGIRRYGFLDKVLDVSESNMQFAPGTFDRATLHKLVEAIENLRNIRLAVVQLLEAVDDHLIQAGNDAYRLALLYYNTVRDAARLGDVGVRTVFDALRPFFANRGRTRAAEEAPTQRQAIRDAKAIIRGEKDGEVLIKGKRRAVTAKELEVFDDTDKPHGGMKITERE